jgi:hypothetical protein
MAQRYGWVRLTCRDPKATVYCLLGPEPVKYTEGGTGWEVVNRPYQTGMTVWNGNPPRQVQLGIMMDEFVQNTPIGPQAAALFKMARGDEESPPGPIEITGAALAYTQWVIESIEHGDPIRKHNMRATRQAFVLTLREYVPPEFLALRRRALAGVKGKTKIIKAKRGDTPRKIARRNKCKWHELRTANGLTMRKADQKLKAGTKVRVPVAPAPPKKNTGTRGTAKGGGKNDAHKGHGK